MSKSMSGHAQTGYYWIGKGSRIGYASSLLITTRLWCSQNSSTLSGISGPAIDFVTEL